MIRHLLRLLPVLAAITPIAFTPAASAMDAAAKRAEIATLKTQAQSAGRLRVVVELRVGPHASRRVLNGIQRSVVTSALGSAAWHDRGGSEVHAVPEMTAQPMFVAAVTAHEIDKLAAHPRVKRVAAEATWTEKPKKPHPPAK